MLRQFVTGSVLAVTLIWPPAPTLAQARAETSSLSFDSDNAILDTAIPFAIGAREARQSLRGSFGWATFQEGLVDGVYFRFDPDGYARFSSSPRLDTDVFEVICRPRTFTCEGRKGPLTIILTGRGQLQLKIENVARGDTLHVTEGVAEIELPERILQPLDIQLENLLMAGGELVVRRGGEDFHSISLVGLYPISTYLRWVAARQDYTVMPRGWPVPNSKSNDANGGLTQALNWISPMPQPQILPMAGAPAAGDQFGVNPAAGEFQPIPDGLAEVKSEINMLRQLLVTQAVPEVASPPPLPMALTGMAIEITLGLEERVSRLETTVDFIVASATRTSLAAGTPVQLAQGAFAQPLAAPSDGLPSVVESQFASAPEPVQLLEKMAGLKRLIAEQFGLTEETAALLASVLLNSAAGMQSADGLLARETPSGAAVDITIPITAGVYPLPSSVTVAPMAIEAGQNPSPGLLVERILRELQSGIAPSNAAPISSMDTVSTGPLQRDLSTSDFLPLEEYLLFLIGGD